MNFVPANRHIRKKIYINQCINIGACYAFYLIKAYQNNYDTDKLGKLRRDGQ